MGLSGGPERPPASSRLAAESEVRQARVRRSERTIAQALGSLDSGVADDDAVDMTGAHDLGYVLYLLRSQVGGNLEQ